MESKTKLQQCTNAREDCGATSYTSWCNVLQRVRFGSFHDLVHYNSIAKDITFLRSFWGREVRA